MTKASFLFFWGLIFAKILSENSIKIQSKSDQNSIKIRSKLNENPIKTQRKLDQNPRIFETNFEFFELGDMLVFSGEIKVLKNAKNV